MRTTTSGLDCAIRLIQKSSNYEDYVIFKILPDPETCFCSGCFPNVWNQLNEFIFPDGPIEHEGNALVRKDGCTFYIEQHESGPEIISLASDLLNIVASVAALVVIISAALPKERKTLKRLVVSRRKYKKGKIVESTKIEIALPLSPDAITELKTKMTKSNKRQS